MQQTDCELHKRSMREIDVWTQGELQWGALDYDALGMLYANTERLAFSGDVNNIVSAHRFKVYAPAPTHHDLSGLHYRYDEEERRPIVAAAIPVPPKGKPVEPTVVGIASIQPMLALGTTPFTKPLPLAAEGKPRLATALGTAPVQDAQPPAVLLQIEGIKAPKDAGIMYEVFVTKAGEKASPTTYIGPISFFGRRVGDHGHGDHEHDDAGFTQGFDATEVFQKLRRANGGTLPDLEVSIVPHSIVGLSDALLAAQKIDVPIANVTLKLVTDDKE